MNSLKVLDVTLRDGGCVNNFNFGKTYMDKILENLEKSEVDFIELGYIDEKFGTEQGRTQFCNEQVIKEHLLKSKKPNVTYVAMIDYGKFNVDNLEDRTDDGIDGIRLAFHKKNYTDMVETGRKIIQKGYKFYVQPMVTMRYSDKELLELIEIVNEKLPDASGFYIVDSFGEMRTNDMNRMLNLVDHNLISSMTLGFHSHNNLQLSYSNAMVLLQYPTDRDIMLDVSVMGMGKGAGNLNTELLLEHLNLYYQKNYKISPLMELIDQVISVVHKEYYWGYSVEYYLSSINHCTPSYAGHFYSKHMLPVDQVADLLSMVSEEKKISFDQNYAEALYRQYNASKSFDDTGTIKKFKDIFENKKVVVIAPGKSIIEADSKIKNLINQDDVISIGLNNFNFGTDYVLTTRLDAFKFAVDNEVKTIVPSHISREENKFVDVIDYKKWIVVENGTHDSSGVVVLKLLNELGVKHIVLAGFDGFHVNVNDNYFDKTFRHPVTEDQAIMRNQFFKDYVRSLGEDINIEFLTPSKYMN